eukprot:CAMPEP_0117677606 /NCGR_PEP_ID=MMETSP0804-20121206/16834_1 /TAXON_ID=1074897 /ORGANISM="Tetraselmis astigmatica, Strain CCMP880" /LENGTH=44 /DNA_ID= /DNA_START= /DNA_END= /DNA_ORIENTATION=
MPEPLGGAVWWAQFNALRGLPLSLPACLLQQQQPDPGLAPAGGD